jgi:hypothetical protein
MKQPMKFRKKPVVIEALQLTRAQIKQCYEFIHGPISTSGFNSHHWDNYASSVSADGMTIQTLEGQMKANIGDWIIKGVKGEFYPCKPDIFEATYEQVK